MSGFLLVIYLLDYPLFKCRFLAYSNLVFVNIDAFIDDMCHAQFVYVVLKIDLLCIRFMTSISFSRRKFEWGSFRAPCPLRPWKLERNL